MLMKQVSDKIRASFEDFNRANNAFELKLLASFVSGSLAGADPNDVIQVVCLERRLAGSFHWI